MLLDLPELVDENPQEASAGHARAVVIGRPGEGEQDLAREAGGQEHRGPVRDVRSQGCGEEHDPHVPTPTTSFASWSALGSPTRRWPATATAEW
ncbi:hypothetical protein ACWEOE_38045 [Amycolatopsis sp. NPDC004368]